jgi:HK97 family phage major capsid protein
VNAPRTADPSPPAGDTLRVEKRGGAPVTASPALTTAGIDPDAIRFRVSNEDVDSLGDIVEQDGLEFPASLPAVADHSHQLNASIGDWRDVERAGPETFATLRLLPRGVSRSADLVRALHAGGFPLASSVFFLVKRENVVPITKAGPNGQPVETGGVRYKGPKPVHEITLTQFPANAAAVAVARSLGFNDAELAALSRPEPARVPVARSTQAVAAAIPPRGPTMTIAEMIAAAQAAHDTAQASLATATLALESDQSEANLAAVQRATGEAEQLFARLTTLRAAEAAGARRAATASAPGASAPPEPTTPVARAVATVTGTAAPGLIRHRGDASDRPPGERLARLVMAASIARARRRSLEDVANEVFAGEAEMIGIARSAVGVADTTTAGWAAELVRTETRALLDQTLNPNAIWPILSAAGTSLTFNGAHSVLIPQMNIGTTVNGAWVGEGGVIPVVAGAFTSKRLYNYKLGGIIPITKELQRTSDPSAVATMQAMLRQFLSNLLDSSLVDASAEVTGVRPAGLLNGVTPITGAAGGGYTALRADLQAVTDAFTAANIGEMPMLLVPKGKAFDLRTMVNALGQPVFPDGADSALGFRVVPSQFVAANTAIAVAAEKFVSAIDPLEFDSSEEATLTLANSDLTAPTQAGVAPGGGAIGTAARQVIQDGGIPVSGGAGASVVGATAMSMYQTWSIGLRMVIPAAFAVTRAGAVQQITGITW